MAENGRISPQQRKAITRILRGRTIADAADHADVAERTVYRWLKDDEQFKTELKEAADEAFSQTLAILRGASTEAARVLARAVFGDNVSLNRLRASEKLIDRTLRAWEVSQDEQLIEQLRDELEALRRELERERGRAR